MMKLGKIFFIFVLFMQHALVLASQEDPCTIDAFLALKKGKALTQLQECLEKNDSFKEEKLSLALEHFITHPRYQQPEKYQKRFKEIVLKKYQPSVPLSFENLKTKFRLHGERPIWQMIYLLLFPTEIKLNTTQALELFSFLNEKKTSFDLIRKIHQEIFRHLPSFYEEELKGLKAHEKNSKYLLVPEPKKLHEKFPLVERYLLFVDEEYVWPENIDEIANLAPDNWGEAKKIALLKKDTRFYKSKSIEIDGDLTAKSSDDPDEKKKPFCPNEIIGPSLSLEHACKYCRHPVCHKSIVECLLTRNNGLCPLCQDFPLDNKILSRLGVNALQRAQLEERFWYFRLNQCKLWHSCPCGKSGRTVELNSNNRSLSCKSCNFLGCAVCKRNEKKSQKCRCKNDKDLKKQLLVQMWTNGFKHCPRCHAPIERSEGCPSMICGKDYHGKKKAADHVGCGYNFNWNMPLENFVIPGIFDPRTDLSEKVRAELLNP